MREEGRESRFWLNLPLSFKTAKKLLVKSTCVTLHADYQRFLAISICGNFGVHYLLNEITYVLENLVIYQLRN